MHNIYYSRLGISNPTNTITYPIKCGPGFTFKNTKRDYSHMRYNRDIEISFKQLMYIHGVMLHCDLSSEKSQISIANHIKHNCYISVYVSLTTLAYEKKKKT